MLDPNPQAPALVPTPRLVLTQTRASRAVLDGAWWPRSRDALAELSSVVPALSKRYGRIRSVLLNGSAWTGRERRLAVADHVVRIGWFASMTEALLIAITDADDQIDLLIVPQTCPRKQPTGLWRRRLILLIAPTRRTCLTPLARPRAAARPGSPLRTSQKPPGITKAGPGRLPTSPTTRSDAHPSSSAALHHQVHCAHSARPSLCTWGRG